MPKLEVRGLRKTYENVVALHEATLEVSDGEFLTLLGPSGCGKTTLLRMIAGITESDQGEVWLAGKRIDKLPPEARNIGMVFQSYALFPHMTVFNNLAFGLRMRGVNRTAIKERVKDALTLVNLSNYAERFPRQLSGGQQQRVALARAVVIEPALLLLDEPLSNLDAKLRDQLRHDLRELQQKLGITSIYVTHDQSEALALSDRIVVMNEGRIVEIGTPSELYQEPRSRFTAEFLGSTNLIEVELMSGFIKLPWGDSLPYSSHQRGQALLSVRPEELVVIADARGQGMIESIIFLGSVVHYQVKLGNYHLLAQNAGREKVLEVGSSVSISISAFHVLQEVTTPSRTEINT
jgi:putative spermidine/putrescine transport system ATP-binding protein